MGEWCSRKAANWDLRQMVTADDGGVVTVPLNMTSTEGSFGAGSMTVAQEQRCTLRPLADRGFGRVPQAVAFEQRCILRPSADSDANGGLKQYRRTRPSAEGSVELGRLRAASERGR